MMRVRSCRFFAFFLFSFALLALPSQRIAAEPGPGSPSATAEMLPEAPQPRIALAYAEPPSQPAQGSSSSSTSAEPSAGPAETPKSKHETAEAQMKEQESQRIVGVLPAFNVSYRYDAVSLTAGQKLRLALRSSIDPVSFAEAFVVAGYHEAKNDDPGFGWGTGGYGKRVGVAYLDVVSDTMIGNALLPSLLHQDPRYFRLGHGAIPHRLLYALATNVMCRHDNTGKWEPNYSNVGGNLLSGALSNLYYPSASRNGVGLTISNGLIQTAEGAAGSIFEEFWPDVSRRLLHRDPTHGRDAQARALDAQEKQAALK
jgi:hypothetical protein